MSILYKIGVTGNICSGKSTLVKYMKKKPNCIILNLDEAVHQIYKRNLFIENSIKHNFCTFKKIGISNNIYTNNEKLFQQFNRKELGKIVFDDDSKLSTLNSILRNELKTKLLTDIEKIEFDLYDKNNQETFSKKYFLFVEGAIIIEASFHNLFDEVWQTKINYIETERRFINRLNAENVSLYDKDTLRKILKKQMTPEEKSKFCKHTIDTSFEFEKTKTIYDDLYEELIRNKLS